MSTNAERLARWVRERREELDLSQLDVWQAGGPSNTTLTEVENGRTERLTRTTARKLDAGLQWEPGSARRVWEGGEPTPLGEQLDDERDRFLRDIASASFLTDEEKEEIAEMMRRHRDQPPDPPAGQQGEVRGA